MTTCRRYGRFWPPIRSTHKFRSADVQGPTSLEKSKRRMTAPTTETTPPALVPWAMSLGMCLRIESEAMEGLKRIPNHPQRCGVTDGRDELTGRNPSFEVCEEATSRDRSPRGSPAPPIAFCRILMSTRTMALRTVTPQDCHTCTPEHPSYM